MGEPEPDRPGTTYVLVCDRQALQQQDRAWAELPHGTGDPPVPEERPDLSVPLDLSGTTVRLTATYDAAFRFVRALYARDGTSGVEAFLQANGMAIPRNNDELTPEDRLPSDLIVVFRLLRAAQQRVQTIAVERVRQLQSLAVERATARLERAHVQIEQAVRYLTGPSIERGTALDDRVPAWLFRLGGRDAQALLTDLVRIRAILARLAEARAARAAATQAVLDRLGPFVVAAAAALDQPPGAAGVNPETPAVRRAIEEDPVVRERTAAIEAVRTELHEYLLVAGEEHPVLFRIYADVDADPARPADVATAVVTALRRADAANHTLRRDLSDDGETVWQFPPSVRETLADLNVPEESITWTAAEERLERAQGPRLAAQLGMVSGLAVGGVALAGAAVAPPVAVAVAVVDGIVNAVDALQEYFSYRRLRAGFDAVLDPALAPGTEPGLIGTVLTIAFDLLSALPAPGAHAATRAASP